METALRAENHSKNGRFQVAIPPSRHRIRRCCVGTYTAFPIGMAPVWVTSRAELGGR